MKERDLICNSKITKKKKKKFLVLTVEDFQKQKYCIQPTKYEACST